MNQATIEKRPSLQALDLLRQFRGIDVSRITSGAFAGTVALSRREGDAIKGGCPMQIVLDGIILPSSFYLELLPPRECPHKRRERQRVHDTLGRRQCSEPRTRRSRM